MWRFLQTLNNKYSELKFIVLLVLIQLVYLFPLANTGIPMTHDGEVQVARFAAYVQSFQDQHIPPRWAGLLNYSYGIPVLNFYYPLPGYLATLLYAFGLSLEGCMKLLTALAFLITPVGMYLFIRQHTKWQSAFIAGLVYGLAPYQFLNVYVRGDIGESLALAFFPFSLYFMSIAIHRNNFRLISFAGLFATLVVLSHHGVGLMFTPLVLCFSFLLSLKSARPFSTLGLFICLWFGISAFFWVPAFFEQKYTLASVFIGEMFKTSFLSFPQVISSAWGFGPDVNLPGGQSPQLGIIPFSLFCITLLSVYRKKLTVLGIISLFFFIFSLFLTFSASSPVWSSIHVLQKYQFPWRFIGLTTASMAMTIGFLYPFKNKIIICIISALILLFSVQYTKTSGFIHHADQWYKQFPSTTFFHGEALTIWSDGEARAYPLSPVEIITGKATVTDVQKKTQLLTGLVNAETEATLRINTVYYPGWKSYVDGKDSPIQFQDPNNRGLITFIVPAGKHEIKVAFEETKLRIIADWITVGSLLLFLFFCLKNPNKKISKI